MSRETAIKAMEEFSTEFGVKLSALGQILVSNRHAYERLRAGTAHKTTADRILQRLDAERRKREAA